MNAPSKAQVDTVNYLNIFLMLASCAMAFFIPFEFLLVSYAFLGPLHYLTEISWLHDKNYFVAGKFDPFLLILPAIPITFTLGTSLSPEDPWVSLLLGFTFGMAAAMVFAKHFLGKLVLTSLFLALFLLLGKISPLFLVLGMLLPSVIHIYIFTGAFILFGALKGKSSSGYFSFGVYLLCPLLFLLSLPTGELSLLSGYVQENLPPFLSVSSELKELFQLEDSWSTTVAIIRFLAFGYTYHYLNWFSKTKIIRWHETSKQRLWVLLLIYLSMISLYAFDYALGFIAAYFVALIHVFLEFPLNHRSFIGIKQELSKRVSGRDV